MPQHPLLHVDEIHAALQKECIGTGTQFFSRLEHVTAKQKRSVTALAANGGHGAIDRHGILENRKLNVEDARHLLVEILARALTKLAQLSPGLLERFFETRYFGFDFALRNRALLDIEERILDAARNADRNSRRGGNAAEGTRARRLRLLRQSAPPRVLAGRPTPDPRPSLRRAPQYCSRSA